jgi:hypothetical protein
VAVAVHEVGLVEQRALPLARLLQEVAPGDGAVLGRREAVVEAGVAHGIVDGADQPPVHGDPGQHREIALWRC